MASTSGIQQTYQQQQQFKCKECGLALNSAESLEVHRQYHEGNLMQQWAVKAQQGGEEKNNNMTKQGPVIKREFISNNSDSSDIHSKKSPDYHRNTPEAIYGHPPTPQSYQSASSPYQNNENNSAFSPNYQNFPIIKSEGNSPASSYQFSNFPDSQQQQQQQQFFPLDPNNYQQQDLHSTNKTIQLNNFRYQPYGRPPAQYYEPPKPSVSPAYPPQPTPSPSPKQCDKCGYVCESAAQLIEHNNLTHNGQQFNQSNHFNFIEHPQIKEEDTSQSEILDLDSHKVVHPDWADTKEGIKRVTNGDPTSIQHSVSAMLNTWPAHAQPANAMFQNDHHLYMNETMHSHQIDNQNFMNNSVSSSQSTPDLTQQQYRPFEHLPAATSSVITSTQAPQQPTVAPPPERTGNGKGPNWKSNEARRPKTYNCTACNKWFTSSGHLKRHYNTTLHKNAVKSSGQPDPATMPISAHHHPARDAATTKEDRNNSNSPQNDSKNEDSNSHYDNRLGTMPGLLQHPPNGPYDRQTMHHTPPMMQNPVGFSSLSNGSPPNGEAGLSPPDSRGLLSITPATNHHSFNMIQQSHHMMPMEAATHHHQFQMYPNGSAPHVTQATDITTSNLNIIGEHQQINYVVQQQPDNQPLPSFSQITGNRFGGGYANVGGLGLVTTPDSMTAYFAADGSFELLNDATRALVIKQEDVSDYKLTVLNSTDEGLIITEQQPQMQQQQFSPTTSNNNNDATFVNTDDTITYISQEAPQPVRGQLTIATTEEEGKENYEAGINNAVGSPSISSTSQSLEEDLSKTKCFDCDKVFNRPCYLTQHNKTCHNGDKPYKCSRCGKRFSDEETFNEHTSKHAGDKPHKCDMCPKMFNHKTDLRRHLCCHTGRKPYACDICGKGFIRKDHMVKHKDTHTRKKEKLSAMRS
ncbi:unnamed protein product [Ceutorhynchus assimilis]|uniref:C2H2-type domain-containing protein n=1 Tax=Ceutorhynchus assimilis TaxID=467358 RepID=A0A9N9MNI6_9CUCU|nr:unnamed protein product [Ceutorhynchus assimilis]